MRTHFPEATKKRDRGVSLKKCVHYENGRDVSVHYIFFIMSGERQGNWKDSVIIMNSCVRHVHISSFLVLKPVE